MEALGFGAVLRTTDGSAPAAEFMTRMRALAERPLSSFDD
eukprot:gene4823-1530_t